MLCWQEDTPKAPSICCCQVPCKITKWESMNMLLITELCPSQWTIVWAICKQKKHSKVRGKMVSHYQNGRRLPVLATTLFSIYRNCWHERSIILCKVYHEPGYQNLDTLVLQIPEQAYAQSFGIGCPQEGNEADRTMPSQLKVTQTW